MVWQSSTPTITTHTNNELQVCFLTNQIVTPPKLNTALLNAGIRHVQLFLKTRPGVRLWISQHSNQFKGRRLLLRNHIDEGFVQDSPFWQL